jgi:hypothetical protein
MSATFVLKSDRLRAPSLALGLFRGFQILLMAAGLLLLVALVDAYRGEGRVMERLQNLIAADALADSVDFAASGGPAVDLDPLTPRMRDALDFVSRRYRVSGEALEPIFIAAETSANALQVDPLLVVAVIAIESRFNPFSQSVVGAQGLMQVMPRWHQDKLPEGADDLSFFDPVLNVQIGTRILKESIVRNGGLVAGLQQFAGAADDPGRRYSGKVLAEKARLEAATRRQPAGTA